MVPKYYSDKLYIGNPKSPVGLITLWSVKEKICKEIPKQSFRVAGQLYSKRGINFLIRNIFANPEVRYIVVCGRDETKTGKILLDFARKGIDKNFKICGSDFSIDKNIPRKDIDLLRKKVEFVDLIGKDDPKVIAKALAGCSKLSGPFTKPKLFPMPKADKLDKLPFESGMNVVRADYIEDAWPKVLRRLLMFGSESRHFHGSMVREIFNLSVVVSKEDPSNPKLIKEFGFDKKELSDYIKNFLSSKKGKEEYTYGNRMRAFGNLDQIKEIERKINGYLSDRGALAVLWDPKTDNAPRKVPCLALVQCNGEGERLHMTAYFRSNDMFNAWPRNAFALRALQREIAEHLKLKVGWLNTISNCAHIYENEWQSAGEISKKCLKRPLLETDARGNLLILVDGKKIIVEQIAPSGESLRKFSFDGMLPKAALVAARKLYDEEVFGNISHAFDLGTELQKAEFAIKKSLKYEQDKPLHF
ncbi:MAG: hypothetical protein ACD_63C00148G0010 [uncultured bacterium]|nr:MAG: hypothetical protein ACD_63C00148G0010 [uncultured bacterium]